MTTVLKNTIYHLIILDESGSMASIKQYAVKSMKQIFDSCKEMCSEFPDHVQYFTLVSFNTDRYAVHSANSLISIHDNFPEIHYAPNNWTPLLDAIGMACSSLKNAIGNKENSSVLVSIITDGRENSSNFYSSKDIKTLIEQLSKNNWKFTYFGTDHDVIEESSKLGIKDTFSFQKSDRGFEDVSVRYFKTAFSHHDFLKSNIFSDMEEDLIENNTSIESEK
ncbi:MAG TPA: VWA domain-containing protein [Bacteroidia bacterium]|nr:VWA domain-containing protein [Bacteroidia bacterium]HNT80184.1 VWA domain-containing protein [Bacteroidia bacterium]